MDKTIEEKRAAVLVECGRLCPNKGDQFHFDWGYVHNWGDHWSAHEPTGSCLFHTKLLREYESRQFQNYPLAYRLLGLETAQAVAELKSKIRALEGSIDSEVRIIKNLSVENRELKTQIKEIKAENERHLTEVEDLWRRKLDAVVQLPIVEYATDSDEVAAIKRELKAEREKSAALVEALPEIARQMFNCGVDLSALVTKTREHDRWKKQYTEILDMDLMSRAKSALEAHKKGGANG